MIIYTDLMRHQRYCPVCPSEPNTLNNFQYQCECHLLSAFATNEMLQSSELYSENVQNVRFVSSSSHGRMLILQQHERTSGEKPWMMNTDTLIAHKKINCNKSQKTKRKPSELYWRADDTKNNAFVQWLCVFAEMFTHKMCCYVGGCVLSASIRRKNTNTCYAWRRSSEHSSPKNDEFDKRKFGRPTLSFDNKYFFLLFLLNSDGFIIPPDISNASICATGLALKLNTKY